MRHRIFVPLLSDANILRESDAVPAGDGRFRLTGSAPKLERLLFKSGELVECEIRTLPNGAKGLVAVRSVSADSETRKKRTVFGVLGAIVGAIFGAVAALCVMPAAISAAFGAVSGAIFFAFCSMRWGDDAWEMLSDILNRR